MPEPILYYIMKYQNILYTIQYFTIILYNTIPYHTISNITILYNTTLYYIIEYFTILSRFNALCGRKNSLRIWDKETIEI